MNFMEKVLALGAFTIVVGVILGIYGWVQNVFILISMVGTNEASLSFLVRLIGVVLFPLGSILGLFF